MNQSSFQIADKNTLQMRLSSVSRSKAQQNNTFNIGAFVVTSIISILIFIFLIQSTVFAYAQDWNVQNMQESIASSVLPERKVETLEKTEPKFNDRQIAYFEESTIQSYEERKNVLVSFKEVLQNKVKEREAEQKRIEEERLKAEAEAARIAEEARLKREAEAQAKREEAARIAAQKRNQTSSSAVSNSTKTSYTRQEVAAQKFDLMRQAGIKESDFQYVDFIITKESTWNHLVWNTLGSSAYGLCQSLPATKMASAGADYMTNPVTQLKWCNGYAQSRYGGWANAYSFWRNNRWW